MGQHNSYMEELINTFDIELLPADLYQAVSEGKIEFFYRSQKKGAICKSAEISVITPDMRRRIFVLYDYGYCMKFVEITINKFMNIKGRNQEIRRLYREFGLSQIFLAHVFSVSQPTISFIVTTED